MSHPQPAVLSAVEDNDEWQPHAPEEFQQVGPVGRLAIGLLGASTVTHLLATWSDWNTYGVVNQYLGGGLDVDDADLNRADTISRIVSIPNVVVSVAAAVVFVIWLWRARVNSEVFCQADHRHSHGWVLASWFCPGPNLWYPKQIVDDVWLASDPRTPVYADDLRRLRKPLLTKVWWCTWVGALAFDVVIRRLLMWMEPTVGTLRGIALAGTASLILTAVSAVGATLIIRKITAMQTGRPWIPWWDQREPRLTAVPRYEQVETGTDERVPSARSELTAVPAYADDATSEQPPISEPIAAPQLRLERSPEFPAASVPAPGPAEEAPQWSPFASVVQSWQDNTGPETQQFSAVEAWQDEPGRVEEATPSYRQTASGLETPAWSASSNPFRPVGSDGAGSDDRSDDLLSLPSWRTETVAPPPLSLVQPDPYSYDDEPEPTRASWSASYSEPYSYTSDTGSDYLTSSTPIPAPEPEPAPVARAGRRAARVAVDSPSTIQAAAYREPVVDPDDYLTPSKPLPPVPAYERETSYTPDPAYDAPADSEYTSTYETSYAPDPTYPGYGSSSSDSYTAFSSTYDATSYTSTSYGDSGYDYSSNYTSESYAGDPSASDHGYQEPATQYQPSPYSYEPAEASRQEPDPTAARTHPRRRWV